MHGTPIKNFLFSKSSTSARGPSQLLIQIVPLVRVLRVKQPGRESNHSFSANFMNKCNYALTPPVWLHGLHRDKFTFTIVFTFTFTSIFAFTVPLVSQNWTMSSAP